MAISEFLAQAVILQLLCCLWTAHSQGVHNASPLLWQAEDSNPLQVGGVYGMDVMTILYAILACTRTCRVVKAIFFSTHQYFFDGSNFYCYFDAIFLKCPETCFEGY